MSRIILIDPRGWQGAANGYRPSPNIGIAYLIPNLLRDGSEILFIDLNNVSMTDEEVLSTTNEYHPDIVCISAKTATMKDARSLAQKIKKLLPNVPLIIGGPHTTISWRNLVAEPWFDVIFVGEGEQILPILIQRLLSGESYDGLAGIVTKNNYTPDLRLNHPLITSTDLNIIPFPEYDLFPENVIESLRTAYPLVTSRGCVYNCTYCSVPEISGHNFRKRSTRGIIEELKCAREKYDIAAFEIIDDVFNLELEHCKKICRAFIDSKLGLSWSCPNGLRADRIDEELAQLMFASGCRSVMIGIESADPKILAAVKKGETIEDIERCIRVFKNAGIAVGGYFIIGLPGDSFELEKRSVNFAKRMGINAHFNMLVPYPGTELWKWAETSCDFLSDIEGGLHFADLSQKVNPVIQTADFSALERKKAYEMVHTRAGRFDMVVPLNTSQWVRDCRILRLLWSYDRLKLPGHIYKVFHALAGRFLRKISQIMKPKILK